LKAIEKGAPEIERLGAAGKAGQKRSRDDVREGANDENFGKNAVGHWVM
jgi:hypothetical protein